MDIRVGGGIEHLTVLITQEHNFSQVGVHPQPALPFEIPTKMRSVERLRRDEQNVWGKAPDFFKLISF